MTDRQISILGIIVCAALLIGLLVYVGYNGAHNPDINTAIERINDGLGVVGLGRR